MKYCENCGCKVFKLGCVNCDEMNYIEEQKWRNDESEIYEFRACTQDVIDEAMRIVSKDVRAPKCVRDGIVKPIKK